jgi:hypothetical protein
MTTRIFHKTNREKDLRKAFDDFILGKSGGIKHAHRVLIRKARRDSEGHVIKCKCVSGITIEPNTESQCPYCLGEGFIWDEKFEECYSTLKGGESFQTRWRRIGAGEIRTDYITYYFRYDIEISYKDKIIELLLDIDGAPILPYSRDVIYRPETIQKMRSDNGRIEYLAVHCREEQAIRLNDK